MPELHQAEARKLDYLVFGEPGIRPVRRLAAVRIGRPPRGSKMGAVSPAARPNGSKMGGRKHDGVSDMIANPASCLVAGAGYTEYYTVPETYWIDL
jgi:hypothetical protein